MITVGDSSTKHQHTIRFYPIPADPKEPEKNPAGRVPADLAYAAYTGWHKRFHCGSMERGFVQIGSFGGLSHFEMEYYSPSKEWKNFFEPGETLMNSAKIELEDIWKQLNT